jgi:hypothetical protein
LIESLTALEFFPFFSSRRMPPQQHHVRGHIDSADQRAVSRVQMLETQSALCATRVQRSGEQSSLSWSSRAMTNSLQPYPPPRGCILVYKKSLCCPYLSCSKFHVNYYKNADRNRAQLGENNYHQVSQQGKIAEKRYRTDDAEEMNGGKRREMERKNESCKQKPTAFLSLLSFFFARRNNERDSSPPILASFAGCIESGSLYASGDLT